MKPISSAELSQAVEKYRQRPGPTLREQLSLYLPGTPSPMPKLAVHETNGIRFISLHDIVRIEAESNYSRFFLRQATDFLSSKGLKYYAELLQNRGFFRCHKSFLVNLREVTRFMKGKKPHLEMSDGQVIPVARNLREDLIRKLEMESLW